MGVESDTLIAGRFRLLSELGRGAMAVVYLAEDRAHPGPAVALKLVSASSEEDDVSLRRFRREAETLAKLRHPNILELLESGSTESGGLWLSMPRLEGEDLDRRLRRGTLTTDEALRIGQGVARALAHAHERGVVHRDLKPSNIFLDASTSPPTPRVLDFGISRVFNDPALTRITSTGRTLGSPGYMSPEQIRGADLDGRSDLYALGVLLFQMLTGRLPLPMSGDMLEVLRAHLERPAPRLSEVAPDRSHDPALEALVTSMLEKQIEKRPRSAAAVAAELDVAIRRSPAPVPLTTPRVSKAPRPSKMTLAITTALGAGASVVVLALTRGQTVEPDAPVVASKLTAPILEPPKAVVARAPQVEPEPETEPSPRAEVPPAEPAPRRARRTEPARSEPPSATPASSFRTLAAPLPNDARLRENIDRLRDGPTPDDRTAARAALLSLFRATIAELPKGSQAGLSQDLAGLAAAGSAEGFTRLHRRVREAWSEGSAP